MVIEDLSHQSRKPDTQDQPARPQSRFLSGLFDFILLSPLVSLIPSFHFREWRLDESQGYSSNLWLQVVVLAFLTHILIQTLFIYFFRATPGQAIMGLKVKSECDQLTWNQALLRSVFFDLSWVFAGLPLLEMFTHPLGCCWQDRISETKVIGHNPLPVQQSGAHALGDSVLGTAKDTQEFSSVQELSQLRFRFSSDSIRASMIVGFFLFFLFASTLLTQADSLTFSGATSSYDSLDALVAKALLKKDDSEDTRAEIDEKLWNSKTSRERALAYFYRFQNEKEKEVKKVLSQQICEWGADSLCLFTQYILDPKQKDLQTLTTQINKSSFLSAQVAVLRELTKQSRTALALNFYENLKTQDELTDELRIWDVSLYLTLQKEAQGGRAPANDSLAKALEKYEAQRGEP